MNFLAHLYLSKNNKNILTGNFIADAVKGSHYKKYPLEVQQGILLHRFIDSYTDSHPIVKQSMHRLNERYRHYDGVIIDIFYDHFLAKNWQQYSEIPLDTYASGVYEFLLGQIETFPEKIQKMLPYMIEYNWLVNYASIEGIEKVLNGMNRRTKGLSKMDQAIDDLTTHYAVLESDFTTFFTDLIRFTEEKTALLCSESES